MTTEQTVKSISAVEAKAKLDAGAQAIDVRPPADWAGGHVPGAMNLPFISITARFREIPGDVELLFFSDDGVKALQAAETAMKLGAGSVFNAEGGMRAWQEQGFSLETIS